jgi:hypothetical protein
LREITPFALPGAAGQVAAAPGAALAAELAARRAATGQSASGAGPSIAPATRKPPPIPPGASRNPPPMPAPAQRPAARTPDAEPAHAGGGALSDAQIQNIYQRYVDARRQNSERTDNVRIETVAKTVRDMLPKLAQKHAGKQIDFEVVVKDGRVALKPVAR